MFNTGRIIIMSNGSVEGSSGTPVWITTTDKVYGEDHYLWGNCILPENDNDSHRAE
jgi:hypothetical protein